LEPEEDDPPGHLYELGAESATAPVDTSRQRVTVVQVSIWLAPPNQDAPLILRVLEDRASVQERLLAGSPICHLRILKHAASQLACSFGPDGGGTWGYLRARAAGRPSQCAGFNLVLALEIERILNLTLSTKPGLS